MQAVNDNAGFLTFAARAAIALRMHEAAVAMHRENGDMKSVRAAQARVNGLRAKAAKAANEARALADKRAWYAARGR